MKGKEWAILIGVIVLVALVVSLVTVNITGNAIKLNQDRFGKYDVYTTSETYNKIQVDNLVNSSSCSKTDLSLSSDKPNDFVALKGPMSDSKIKKIELISASDSAATIRVTSVGSDGIMSDQGELNEFSWREISGVVIFLIDADETNRKLSARLTVDHPGCN